MSGGQSGQDRGNVERRGGPRPAPPYPLIAVLMVLAVVGLALSLPGRFRVNQAAVTTVRELASSSLRAGSGADGEAQRCEEHWFRGLAARNAGDERLVERMWTAAIRCSPRYVAVASVFRPDSEVLALAAVQHQPGQAESWFWLARVRQDPAPSEAIRLLRRGLALNPDAGIQWRILGDLLLEDDPRQAIDAYYQSCVHGDPGFQGCMRAAQSAEQLGDLEQALRYYRLSHFPSAQERVRELEQAPGPSR